MPYNCRSCVTPLRLDRGSSRCISCCKSSEDLDCCHCDSKRHTQRQASNPLTVDVDGNYIHISYGVMYLNYFCLHNVYRRMPFCSTTSF